MKMKYLPLVLLSFFIQYSCSEDPVVIPPIEESEIYFPSISESNWESISLENAGYNQSNLPDLLNFLEEKNTKGFIVLKKGRIVIENYFNGHSQTATNKWASAAKTLTGTVIGIAQEEGFLDINNPTSDYLGTGWTSASNIQENAITVRHQLTMTTGLDDLEFSSTDPEDLTFTANAGERWAYHNGPYTLLQQVITNATGQDFRTYFEQKLESKIGMNGFWFSYGDFEVYKSDTRSMARFGLLVSNDYKWDETYILQDTNFKQAAHNTSQDINKAYGYLWWLNEKNTYMLPQTQFVFDGSMIPNAPNDMYMAMGRDQQRIYIVPSKDLVVIRMGDQTDEDDFALSVFDSDLWEKLNTVINN